jgi:hypothetical protein
MSGVLEGDGPRAWSWRRLTLVAVAVLALPALAVGTWSWRMVAARSTAGHSLATRTIQPSDPQLPLAASPTPTESPSPSPSPSTTPTQATARAAPPAPHPAAAPAHPPAAPPPALPPAPTGVTVAVPVQRQVYNLSCEESSLSMVMAFYGRTISDQDVLTFIGVDQVHYFTGPGGGDPFVDFVGDPNGSEVRNTGYGVYWPPIQSAATHFGAPASQAGQGIAATTVYAAVGAGRPAIVWVTFDLAAHARSDYAASTG